MTDASTPAPSDTPAGRKPSALQRLVFLGITALCFVFLYLVFSGPGPWSVDAMQGRERAPARA